MPQALQVSGDTSRQSARLSDEYKERSRNEVREWGKKMALNQWDWHSLSNGLEDNLDAIKYNPDNQHAWTNIAYIYYLIGAKDIAEVCLQRSYELAAPGPNHPGRNYKNVARAISNNSFLSGGRISRPHLPDWFSEKYKDFLTFGKTNFHNIEYYLRSNLRAH